VITLTTYDDARDAFRSRDLRQALYDAGHRLMSGVIVNLHGDEHVARRRLENRLFRRDTFAWYESDRIPQIIETVLEEPIEHGRGELLELARRVMMTLSIDVAGVDLPLAAADRTAALTRLSSIMERLARASTVAHAVGDTAPIVRGGDEALEQFDVEFFRPSLLRRQALVDEVERGGLAESELPRDVLTTLLRNQDRLDLPDATVLREIAYFPWVGSHSTSAQLVHVMHHVFEWLRDHPGERDRLEHDPVFRQRFVHESMRLHPASPVALRMATTEVRLRSGMLLPEGETVAISVEQANRDPQVFGPRPDDFEPERERADGVAPWGLSFGHGTHACLGQELAGGLDASDGPDQRLMGSVALMAGAMLEAGARPDPDEPATLDTTTTRVVWGRYPVVFGPTS
jgi:cytochrome P450